MITWHLKDFDKIKEYFAGRGFKVHKIKPYGERIKVTFVNGPYHLDSVMYSLRSCEQIAKAIGKI